MRIFTMLCCACLVFAGCRDREAVFVSAAADFSRLLDLYLAVKDRPEHPKANAALAAFLRGDGADLADRLARVWAARLDREAEFQACFVRHRPAVVECFRKLELVGREERTLFSLFQAVFAPERPDLDRAGFEFRRRLFLEYVALAERLAARKVNPGR